MNYGVIALVISTVVGIYIGILMRRPISSLCDAEKCPFCYGNDLCKDIDDKRIHLRYQSFADLFYNLLSVKNVFFGEYDGVSVVLKKLAHESELNRVRAISHVTVEVISEFIDSGSANSLKTCNKEVSKSFVESLKSAFELEHIWTVLQVNVEPLILHLFRNESWPVPKLYGSCGFLVVEQNCGLPLNHFQDHSWYGRAFLAAQLLEAAIDFTHKHRDFRMYLTDISPDNIAVDDNLTLYFVDLENVILNQKIEDNKSVHYSEHFDEEDFIYSEDEVCKSSISDHNVYAVCRLLLSRRAPWPMMPNGLLHTPPARVVASYNELFSLIEECVDSGEKLSRFYLAEELIRLLKKVNQ